MSFGHGSGEKNNNWRFTDTHGWVRRSWIMVMFRHGNTAFTATLSFAVMTISGGSFQPIFSQQNWFSSRTWYGYVPEMAVITYYL